MSFNLAPYNDAMSLGQGFNSYTQQLCIDKAVKITRADTKKTSNLSQVVSYSARIVEKLSDVVEGMNLSYCSSIKKGTVEVSGSTTTINENSFKSSDLNAVISVKVTNQTITSDSNAEFLPIEGINAGSATFNQTYGDSYISGFVNGGEFTGIVSIKVIDRSKVAKTVNEIKSALAKAKQREEVVFSPVDSMSLSGLSSCMTGVESTISVAWMGGGQIKAPETAWDLESVLAAAAAFPSKVAECPQRTWAILTKYKANRDFVEKTRASPAQVLEYDQINSYTAELFNHYMDYKLLLKHLQAIINDRDNYMVRSGVSNALDTSLETLLSAKAVLMQEQAKIVEAVGVLSKDPRALARQAPMTNVSRSSAVLNILAAQGITSHSGRTQIPPTPATTTASSASSSTDQHVSFDFSSLLAPEIWENVMPVLKPSAQADNSGISSSSLMNGFKLPPPPGDQYEYPVMAETNALISMEADLENQRKEVVNANAARDTALQRAQDIEDAAKTANSKFVLEKGQLTSQVESLNQRVAAAEKTATDAVSQKSNLEVKVRDLTSDLTAAKVLAEERATIIKLRDAAILEKDASITTAANDAADLRSQLLPAHQTRDDINILLIIWNWKNFTNNLNVVEQFKRLIASGTDFLVDNQLFPGEDADRGHPKYAVIVYRRKTGPVEYKHMGAGMHNFNSPPDPKTFQ